MATKFDAQTAKARLAKLRAEERAIREAAKAAGQSDAIKRTQECGVEVAELDSEFVTLRIPATDALTKDGRPYIAKVQGTFEHDGVTYACNMWAVAKASA